LLNEYELKFFLKKFPFHTRDENSKLFIILNSIANFNQTNIDYSVIKTNSKNSEFTFLTPSAVLKLLNANDKTKNLSEDFILPIPDFLKIFFFLLTQVDLALDDIYDVCLDLFLPILPDFI